MQETHDKATKTVLSIYKIRNNIKTVLQMSPLIRQSIEFRNSSNRSLYKRPFDDSLLKKWYKNLLKKSTSPPPTPLLLLNFRNEFNQLFTEYLLLEKLLNFIDKSIWNLFSCSIHFKQILLRKNILEEIYWQDPTICSPDMISAKWLLN